MIEKKTAITRVEKFEDLVAWQKARVLTGSVYRVTKQGALSKDFGLAGQMQRASVSIMSNIAEGRERSSSAEYHQFLSVAKASCAELLSQLYVAFDVGYINQNDFDDLHALAQEVARLVGALRASIGRRRDEQRRRG
jgi:four helix bundle protein